MRIKRTDIINWYAFYQALVSKDLEKVYTCIWQIKRKGILGLNMLSRTNSVIVNIPPQELQSSAGGPEWQLVLQWLRLLQQPFGQHLPSLPPPPVGWGHGEGGSGHDSGQGHCCHGNLHTAGLVQLPGDGGGDRIQDSVEQCSSARCMYCFHYMKLILILKQPC